MLTKIRTIPIICLSAAVGFSVWTPVLSVHAAATLEEMAREIPMYDPKSGEYFLAENQSDADELMTEFGYVQITAESFDTHVPDIVRTADDVIADEKAKDATGQNAQTSDPNKETGKAAQQTTADSVSEDDEVPDSAVLDSAGAAVSSGAEKAADPEKTDQAEPDKTHGPYTTYTKEAHAALLSCLDAEDPKEHYVEIYAASDSIRLTGSQRSDLDAKKEPYEIRIVGPKGNVLYQYEFPADGASKTSDDLELKMTEVPTDDVETYISFHKDQTLAEPIVFSLPVKYANTNFELRNESGDVIAKTRSDEKKMAAFSIGETGNYDLINTDLEKTQDKGQEAQDGQKTHLRTDAKQMIKPAMEIAGAVALACGIVFWKKRRH